MIEGVAVYISLYFAIMVALYQALHCYYVSKDPGYRGKLGLGWPWLHRGTVSLSEPSPWYRNYTFQSTLTLLICSFVVSLAALNPVFSCKSVSIADLSLAVLALLAIGVFSQIMGAAGYKGFLTIFLIAQIVMLYYLRSGNLGSWVLHAYIGGAATVTFTTGFGWMQVMLSRFTKTQRQKSLYVMGLYAIGSLLFTWMTWVPLVILIGS